MTTEAATTDRGGRMSSIEEYLARGPRPKASPAWIEARNLRPTGLPIGDDADMIDDDAEDCDEET